jgi:hypothetical protein
MHFHIGLGGASQTRQAILFGCEHLDELPTTRDQILKLGLRFTGKRPNLRFERFAKPG